ncbi:MAG: cupin domain-containing protein [Gemmatimonadota bacterium]|nr:cupin domain-containing protein [Gemmatimonadota bacterium]
MPFPPSARFQILCAAALIVFACSPPVRIESSPNAVAPNAVPLILGANDGETRVRRFAGASTEFTIKVDEQNGGSRDFLMLTEEMQPGASIPPHRHLLSDEILFIHSGSGTVQVGDKTGTVSAGATVYIPANTRITLRNTGSVPLAVVALFARQGFEDYLRETSALKGEAFVPLTPAELAVMKRHAEHHTVYEQK